MAIAKKTKRLLAYTAILGGCAALSLTFFTISQFEKAKYQASVSVQLMSGNKFDHLKEAYKAEKGMGQNDELDNATFLADTASKYHEAAMYWDDVYSHFTVVTEQNSAAYVGTAVPAYILSMSTLVAFGLILKHAEKAKEKEDEEAVLR